MDDEMAIADDETPDDGVEDDDDALAVAEPPEPATSLSPEMGLGHRGASLWKAVLQAGDLDAAGRVLLLEACRIADRLEQLNRITSGEADVWAHLVHDLRTNDYELRIDGALVEARQQASTLRLLLGQLGLGKLTEKPEARGDGLDELLARRARRGPAAAAAQPAG